MPSPRFSEEIELHTPAGTARALIRRARRPVATLVLGHGAGAPIARSPDLMALLRDLPARRISVIGFDQPWVVAGRKVATAPAMLDEAWLAALPQLPVRGPLVVGGRSAGARVACRTAVALGAIGCLCLAFPLHPPGRPERSRAAELVGAGVPVLVCQGESDSFGRPQDFPVGIDVRAVPGTHALDRPATQGLLTDLVHAWVEGLLAPPSPPVRAR